jgi:hypothetical protein
MSRVALTDELQRELVALLELGLPVERACTAVGIGESTFRAWRSRRGARFTAFRDATDAARAKGEATLVRKITAQTGKSWRAAAWLLESAYGWGRGGTRGERSADAGDTFADPLAGIIDLNARRRDRA